MRVPIRRSEILAQTKKQDDHYVTPAAIERMKNEIKRLLKERPALVEEVQRTAEEGDFSENAGYQAAKAALRRLNGRITWLEERLKYAIPIEDGPDDGRIRIGSTVTLTFGDREMTVQILGVQEANPSRGTISYVSPLGAALMGHAAGDTVTVKAQEREISYVIRNVE